MKDFRKLLVWQKAHALTIQLYPIVNQFPKDELFCLTRQMKRSAISIGSNISEGCGRRTQKDFARFLVMANASASELESQIILSVDLDFIENGSGRDLLDRVQEIKRMLFSLINKLNESG